MPCYSIEGVVPVVDPSAYVHPSAVLIGDVIIGPECYVGPCASLRGDFGRIVLERGANVQDTCVIHGFPQRDTVVEENGHIGHGAVLHSCVVRRDALVGMNAVVMDDAEVCEASDALDAPFRGGDRQPFNGFQSYFRLEENQGCYRCKRPRGRLGINQRPFRPSLHVSFRLRFAPM